MRKLYEAQFAVKAAKLISLVCMSRVVKCCTEYNMRIGVDVLKAAIPPLHFLSVTGIAR